MNHYWHKGKCLCRAQYAVNKGIHLSEAKLFTPADAANGYIVHGKPFCRRRSCRTPKTPSIAGVFTALLAGGSHKTTRRRRRRGKPGRQPAKNVPKFKVSGGESQGPGTVSVCEEQDALRRGPGVPPRCRGGGKERQAGGGGSTPAAQCRGGGRAKGRAAHCGGDQCGMLTLGQVYVKLYAYQTCA